jgi:putative membrane protein
MWKRIIVNALALGLVTWLLDGITLSAPDTPRSILTLLGVAVIFGIVNAVVKPVLKFFTGCLVILTFGLFLLVINAAMLLLTGWICEKLALPWDVAGFWWAVGGSLIISLFSFFAYKVFPDKDAQEENH